MELMQKDELNKRDNETKLKVAEINSRAEELRLGMYAEENNVEIKNRELDLEQEKLRNEILQFDKELRFKETELKQKKEIENKKIVAQLKQKEGK